jgi:hypothetical protein
MLMPTQTGKTPPPVSVFLDISSRAVISAELLGDREPSTAGWELVQLRAIARNVKALTRRTTLELLRRQQERINEAAPQAVSGVASATTHTSDDTDDWETKATHHLSAYNTERELVVPAMRSKADPDNTGDESVPSARGRARRPTKLE